MNFFLRNFFSKDREYDEELSFEMKRAWRNWYTQWT